MEDARAKTAGNPLLHQKTEYKGPIKNADNRRTGAENPDLHNLGTLPSVGTAYLVVSMRSKTEYHGFTRG